MWVLYQEQDSTSPGSLLETQNLRFTPDLLNQKLPFKKIPYVTHMHIKVWKALV